MLARVVAILVKNAVLHGKGGVDDESINHVEVRCSSSEEALFWAARRTTSTPAGNEPTESHVASPTAATNAAKLNIPFTFEVSNTVASRIDVAAVQRCFLSYAAEAPSFAEDSGDGLGESRFLERDLKRSQQGLGLGLFVAFSLVQIMGGILECDSTDHRVRFFFTLHLPIAALKDRITATPTSAAATATLTALASADAETDPLQMEMDSEAACSIPDATMLTGPTPQHLLLHQPTSINFADAMQGGQFEPAVESPASEHHLIMDSDLRSGPRCTSQPEGKAPSDSRTPSAGPTTKSKLDKLAGLDSRWVLVVDDSTVCQKVETHIYTMAMTSPHPLTLLIKQTKFSNLREELAPKRTPCFF
jgi:hypothetical protein